MNQLLSRTAGHAVRQVLRAVMSLVLLMASGLAGAAPLDVMLVLDNSGSMRKNDPEFLLKRAVAKFVSGFADDVHVGMVIFDQDVDYAVPVGALDVESRAAIQKALDAIDYRGQFTDSPAGIERAIYELKSEGRSDVPRVIVFMTDGIVDTGNADADTQKTKWLREDLGADAADNDIRIFGIAFTDNADFLTIQSLSSKTRGEYYRAPTPDKLATVFGQIQEELEKPPAPPEPPPAPVRTLPTPCLDQLTDAEREEMIAVATAEGVNAEKFCNDIFFAPAPPEAVPAPPPQVVEDQGVDVVLIAILGALLVVIVLIVIILLRRRGEGGGDAEPPPVIPDAFIKDINGITETPAVKLGVKPLLVGRIPGNDPEHLEYFIINKGTVGRRHALIQYRDFGFYVSDQGSVNGTFLNGEQIDGERQLKHGDRLKFHKYEFEFSMPEMEDAGHTVFADPNDATMVGEPGSDFAAAATAATAAMGATAATAMHADDDDPLADFAMDDDDGQDFEPAPATDGFDMESGPTMAIDSPPETAAPAGQGDESDDLDDESPTELSARAIAEQDGAEQADDFDAEASAFFDEDDLAPAGVVDDLDDASTGMFDEPEPAAEPESGEDFAEAATVLPHDTYDEDSFAETSVFEDEVDEYAATQALDANELAGATRAFDDDDDLGATRAFADDDENLGATAVFNDDDEQYNATNSGNISLDEFMRTDSFEAPLADIDEDDSDDMTLMPDEVPPGATSTAPLIDDVFDITGDQPMDLEGEGDEDEDDDSESPTEFRR